MEEIKPKRKANQSGQPAQERTGATRRGSRGEKTARPENAGRKPRRRAPRATAAAETPAATQSVPAPRPRRGHNGQQAQNGSGNGKAPRRNRKPQAPRNYEMTPAIPMHICPLGGLGEVGKNITLYECQGDMILVDCGLVFPDADMFGVDLVIPDFTYVLENKDRIKGLFITHGHEDHI